MFERAWVGWFGITIWKYHFNILDGWIKLKKNYVFYKYQKNNIKKANIWKKLSILVKLVRIILNNQ